jgi:hypothetical protein
MMVRRIDDEGYRWLEPPYTTEEQKMLGGRPPYPERVTAETFLVSVDAADERWQGLELSDFEMTLYYFDGTDPLNATVNGKALGHEAAQILRDAMTGEHRPENWVPFLAPLRK